MENNHKLLVCVNNYNKDENAVRLFKLFSKYFDTVIVDTYHLDNDNGRVTEEPCDVDYLHNVFCGGLFEHDYELFHKGDYSHLLIIESDILISEEGKLIDRIKTVVNDPDYTVYAYSPSLTYNSSSFGSNRLLISNIFGYNLGTGFMRDTHKFEGWFQLYHKDVVENVLKYVKFENNKYGWYVCDACTRFSIKSGKRCVIDDAVSVYHPAGCGYPQLEANEIGIKFKDFIFNKLDLYYIDEK